MNIVNTHRLRDTEFVSTFPTTTAAEAATEVGADMPDTAMEAMGYLVVYAVCLLACIGAGALWAWLS